MEASGPKLVLVDVLVALHMYNIWSCPRQRVYEMCAVLLARPWLSLNRRDLT